MIDLRIAHITASGVILAMLMSPWGNISRAAGAGASAEMQASRTSVRSGDHPAFGRVVIDTNGRTMFDLNQDGDHVVVRFASDMTLADPPAPPRNVIAIKTDGSIVDLILKAGARLHPMRLDGRVVLDVLDAADGSAAPTKPNKVNIRPDAKLPPRLPIPSSGEMAGRPAQASGSPSAKVTAERQPVGTQSLPGSGLTSDGIASSVAAPVVTTPGKMPLPQSSGRPKIMEPSQQTPPGRDVLPENDGPVSLLARRVRLPTGMEGSAFLVPFDSATGAAAFSGGDSTYLIFDERRPVDMSVLRSDPVFSATSVQLLPNGTLFRVQLGPSRAIALTQMPQGWRIAALPASPKQESIVISNADGHLDLAAEQPSDVVSLADPETGATLLVGTQRRSGQGLTTGRRGPEFILRPTIQGVVVEALSDAIALRQTPAGFTLAGGPSGLLLSPSTSATSGLMDAALLTKWLDFSTLPPEALLRRATAQIADAAASPPLARGLKHHRIAESLMALGLAVEAESLLHMAAEQDPKEAASAQTGALTGIAALLAGRPDEADALMDPRLDGTDEIALWRAIRQAMKDDSSPGAAAVLAATAPLALQYPMPIRDHILPLIIETMIKGGEIAPAARLLEQRKNDPKLDYARALMRQGEGDTDQALGMLDTLANGRDQFDRARAAIRAVELRLATRKLDRNKAADAFDKLLYAWRGDARELALRERVADLRGQTGAWRVALTMLRQAEADFPEQAGAIHERLQGAFAAMIRDQGEQQLPPIDFVATIDENADLLSESPDSEAVQQALAERLVALDLPERAKPVLKKLLESAKSDAAKARFGFSLATLESRDGNDAAARAALEASEGSDLPPDLAERRTILRASSVARLGDSAAAVALLSPVHTLRATEARALILEGAADWAGAKQAWSDAVALTLPDTGMLDDPQTRTVLRLATATARAGDDAGLADLRVKYRDRIGASPLADMFRLLTAEPIRTSADIQRAQQEANLAASVPGGLKALQSGTQGR